jgi:DNA polymerase-1
MSAQADPQNVCVTGSGPNDTRIMIVTKLPLGPKARTELAGYLEEAGIDPESVMWCSALKCKVWDLDPNKTDQKACRPYLNAEIDFVKPEYIVAIGNEALFATTGKSGIMKYRGKWFSHTSGAQVMATIAPGMVSRNPGFRDGLVADLRYFNNRVRGISTQLDPYHTPGDARRTYVGSRDALRAMLAALDVADAVSYDVETTGAGEYESGAAIVTLSLTIAGPSGMDSAHVWEIPLFHPQSPWRKIWRRILAAIRKYFIKVPRRIAHNAKFDTRWLRWFGIPDLTPTFDTIIAAALLDENRPKGLKPLAQQLLGADPWGIDTKDLLNTPLPEVLEYNGLDTWHDLRLYYIFRDQLKQQRRIGKLFVHLMMPLVQELVPVEQIGIYVDQEVLATNTNIAKTTLADIEDHLMEYVPQNWADIPEDLKEINFGPSNFARWLLFDHIGLPVLARGKTKDDGSPGMPSMAEAVMLELAEVHPVGILMGERALWYKRITGFFDPYAETVDQNSRIHTVFKPWGTVTGRLSSGKEDAEKLTARGAVRGVNLQQVPRDKLLRGVFGAPPGSTFVEADYSQVELRLAAFLAREDTMLHLYATGQDIHMAMAMRMTGKPAKDVTKEERKRAKAVNFGFLYGMGWAKFIITAWLNYQVRVTEHEARAFRETFFTGFPKLMPWHAKQRRLVNKFGRVETPMGRIRHLPDIYSPDQGVRAEAERQAINSPVQAFASDMAALSMVYVAREMRARGMSAHPVGLVHDAVNYEIPNDELSIALPMIKDTMENLPLERLFGVTLDVPIIADLKRGRHWGGAREIPGEVVMNDDALRVWLQEDDEANLASVA